LAKIESAYKSQIKGEPSKNQAAMGGPDTSLGPGISKPATPPMQSLAKANMKIKMGKGEIE
jgi:hypothetical protein